MSENQNQERNTVRKPQNPNQITTQEQAFAEIQRLSTERDDTRRQLAEIHTLLARLTRSANMTTQRSLFEPAPLPTGTTTDAINQEKVSATNNLSAPDLPIFYGRITEETDRKGIKRSPEDVHHFLLEIEDGFIYRRVTDDASKIVIAATCF